MNKRTEHTKLVLLISIFLLGSFQIYGQTNINKLEGNISYITGESIYVKFQSTRKIENGDTLFTQQDMRLIPTLLVKHKSSISCLCNSFGEHTFKVGDKVFAKTQAGKKPAILIPTNEQTETEQDINEQVLKSSVQEPTQTENKGKVYGRLSLSSYSNFSNTISSDSYRFRYTFSLLAKNISGTKISAETYLSFSHKLDEWDEVQENLNNALKVYGLALRYDFNSSTSIWAGRKINPRIANIGAVDGFQFQKSWNAFYLGAVIGSRPDYMDYSFNPDLLEYGAYIGHNSKSENGFAQSSLAFIEQLNQGNTDRRFMYFQHSNTLLKNLTLFSSFELDLYKLENDEPQSTLSLTGLYFSLRYKITRQLSFFGSYDNRKNVIYYETFKNYTDEILQQAARQGFRARVSYRPIKFLNLSADAGTRFRDGDSRHSNTLRGYATYSQLPGIKASLTLSGNLLQTSYLDGQVFGARLSKSLIQGKLYTMLNYRMVNFDYINNNSQLNQHIAEIDFSYNFNKKLYCSVNFETTFQEENIYNRVYLNLKRKF